MQETKSLREKILQELHEGTNTEFMADNIILILKQELLKCKPKELKYCCEVEDCMGQCMENYKSGIDDYEQNIKNLLK